MSEKSVNVIHQINKIKYKNHVIILIDTENAFHKIQHPFIIKTLSRVGVEGTFLNIIKATYDKPLAIIVLKAQKLNTFSLRSGKI